MKTIDPTILAIGSVQFGLDYGISNPSGKTGSEEVTRILSEAKKSGINTIDTAYAYGESEAVLGKQNLNNWKVISKFPNTDTAGFTAIFQESLYRLKVDTLYGYLAHNAAVLIENPQLWKDLQKLKAEGRIKKIGYSLYSPSELDALMELGMIPDLIQIPFNILDTRFENRFTELKRLNVEIHTRSTFLQGLFFMDSQSLPKFFDPVKPFLHSLNSEIPNLADRAGALLGFVARNKNISRVVMGINNANQLRENIDRMNIEYSIPEPERSTIPERIVNPSRWPK